VNTSILVAEACRKRKSGHAKSSGVFVESCSVNNCLRSNTARATRGKTRMTSTRQNFPWQKEQGWANWGSRAAWQPRVHRLYMFRVVLCQSNFID